MHDALDKLTVSLMLDRCAEWARTNQQAATFLLHRVEQSRRRLEAESEPISAAAHHVRTLQRLQVFNATGLAEALDPNVADIVEPLDAGDTPQHVPPGMSAQDFAQPKRSTIEDTAPAVSRADAGFDVGWPDRDAMLAVVMTYLNLTLDARKTFLEAMEAFDSLEAKALVQSVCDTHADLADAVNQSQPGPFDSEGER